MLVVKTNMFGNLCDRVPNKLLEFGSQFEKGNLLLVFLLVENVGNYDQ